MRASELPCQACEGVNVSLFYEHANVPMNSMLLLSTEEEARTFPRGDVALGVCADCGFVSNTSYDPGSSEYSQRYESSQAFSGAFNSFARELAQGWIDRHDLRNKTVLEIGCDKGDFLSLMCELGDNTGIGVDPAADPSRQQRSGAAGRMTFIADFYGEKYQHLMADAVICRHTLEHIPNVLEFMRGVRAALGDQLDTMVLFELPDVRRILLDAAFWDVYYEHCTYFTAGSLARLFRLAGFDVLKVTREFDDQYLIIEAKPSAAGSGPVIADPLPIEEPAGEVVRDAAEFERLVNADLGPRRADICALVESGKKVIIWGGGSKGVSFLTTLDIEHEIGHAVDVNPYKQGRFLSGYGQSVVSPADLKTIQPDVVIVMNPIYVPEISAMLNDLGVVTDVRAVTDTLIAR
jgi:SAM-dependent methyltransferase